MTANGVVHIVDDDDAVRQSLAFLLSSAGLPVRLYDSASAFLAGLSTPQDGCLITDVRMGCTVKPWSRAFGRSSCARACICSATRAASSAERMLSLTPPTSDLCEMSSDRILTAIDGN